MSAEIIRQLLDLLPSAPDRNCSCHVAPPCGDCMDWSHQREVEAEARAFLAAPPDGAARITAERRRHTEVEGWTPAHDDEHSDGSLAVAAACYATQANQGLYEEGNKARDAMLRYWPWDRSWWKPTPEDRIRELEKAGALCAAEIDRLLRAEKRA